MLNAIVLGGCAGEYTGDDHNPWTGNFVFNQPVSNHQLMTAGEHPRWTSFFFSSDLSGLTPSGRHDRRTLPWCGIPNHEPSIIINHLWIIIDSCKSPVGRISTNRNWMVYGKCSIVFPQWFHNHHRISHQSSQHVLHPMVSIIFPQFSTGFPEFPWFRSLQTRLVPFFVDQGRRLGWPFEKCRSSGFFGAGRWVLDVGTLWLWLT